jgi:hypothetical protein
MNTQGITTTTEELSAPAIPVGLATKLGLFAAALAALVAAGTAVLHGDHTLETITALIIAGVNVYGVVGGRMGQAAAAAARVPLLVNEVGRIVHDAQPVMGGSMGAYAPGSPERERLDAEVRAAAAANKTSGPQQGGTVKQGASS